MNLLYSKHVLKYDLLCCILGSGEHFKNITFEKDNIVCVGMHSNVLTYTLRINFHFLSVRFSLYNTWRETLTNTIHSCFLAYSCFVDFSFVPIIFTIRPRAENTLHCILSIIWQNYHME